MNAADLNGFFFNLIPGSFFILSLYIISLNEKQSINDMLLSSSNNALTLIVFVISSLFIGFFFQSITKILREMILDEKMAKKVINQEDGKIAYKQAEKIIKYSYNLENISLKGQFYLMDNYLRAKNASFNIVHFSSRFSLWANMFWVSTVLFILLIILTLINLFFYTAPIILIILLLFIIYSYGQAKRHFFSYYDVILKSFVILECGKEKEPVKSINK